jgi:uncharacterized protein YegP (UPF0339 family)
MLSKTRSSPVRSAAPGVIPDPITGPVSNGSPAARFLVFEDNGGAYHWTIVNGSAETLVRSASFATYDEAAQAARVVRAGAASASLEQLGGDTPPVDLAARRKTAVVRDDLDAERWLDEGGSFSSEAVTRWPAPR